MLLRTVILCLLWVPLSAFSQVHSLTLGIDVNSPYGLSEPWFTIRNALLRCEDFQSVAERPDRKAATAEVLTKNGELPDIAKLQKVISESGAGATLRGVEATVEGELLQNDGKWVLRIRGKELSLKPLTVLIQHERNRPRPPKDEELNAYERLVANRSKRVRVTGPLRSEHGLSLEVRAFESEKLNNSQPKL